MSVFLLLLAATVPDEKVEDLSLGVLGPSALEGDRGQHLVAAPIERNHLSSEQSKTICEERLGDHGSLAVSASAGKEGPGQRKPKVSRVDHRVCGIITIPSPSVHS
jgi:hypothetical protein